MLEGPNELRYEVILAGLNFSLGVEKISEFLLVLWVFRSNYDLTIAINAQTI